MEKWLGPVIKELGTTNSMSDCRIIVEAADGSKQTFECHKLLLSCVSNEFESEFYGDSKKDEIVLENVRPDIFAKFREFLYDYDIKKLKGYNVTTLIDLVKLANRFVVTSLAEECCEILLESAERADIAVLIQLYQFGNEISLEELIQDAWENIANRFLCSMNHNDIYGLSCDVFYNYMSDTKAILGEAMRFEMIDKYLKTNGIKMCDVLPTKSEDIDIDQGDLKNTVKDCQDTVEEKDKESIRKEQNKGNENKETKEIVQNKEIKDEYMNLLTLIEYAKMTPHEFFYGPGKSEYFDIEEKYLMLYKTTLPKDPPPGYERL